MTSMVRGKTVTFPHGTHHSNRPCLFTNREMEHRTRRASLDKKFTDTFLKDTNSNQLSKKPQSLLFFLLICHLNFLIGLI